MPILHWHLLYHLCRLNSANNLNLTGAPLRFSILWLADLTVINGFAALVFNYVLKLRYALGITLCWLQMILEFKIVVRLLTYVFSFLWGFWDCMVCTWYPQIIKDHLLPTEHFLTWWRHCICTINFGRQHDIHLMVVIYLVSLWGVKLRASFLVEIFVGSPINHNMLTFASFFWVLQVSCKLWPWIWVLIDVSRAWTMRQIVSYWLKMLLSILLWIVPIMLIVHILLF